MAENQLNIKSSTLEKGLDLAKEFLGKLIGPTIEEVGLLAGDNVKIWRFKNQIRLLNNVERYIQQKNIDPKKVPLKILLPLLENASLEEEPILIELWENLLLSYVDSSKVNYKNVFPRILAELSSEDAQILNKIKKCCHGYINISGKQYREIPGNKLRGYFPDASHSVDELNNLIRLGILKEQIHFNHSSLVILSSGMVDTQDEVISLDTILLTEFGNEFLEACHSK